MAVHHGAKPTHRLTPLPAPMHVVMREPAGLLHSQSQRDRRQHRMLVGDESADRVHGEHLAEGPCLLQHAAFEEALLLKLHPQLLEGAIGVELELLWQPELLSRRGVTLGQLRETIGGKRGSVRAVAVERIEHPSGIAPIEPLNPTGSAGVSQCPSAAVVPLPIDAQACFRAPCGLVLPKGRARLPHSVGDEVVIHRGWRHGGGRYLGSHIPNRGLAPLHPHYHLLHATTRAGTPKSVLLRAPAHAGTSGPAHQHLVASTNRHLHDCPKYADPKLQSEYCTLRISLFQR
mmetsp:Transcript_22719/g.49756  ORF Transcript_22719/g.49756 Transcript_22719/m.49756 type:complete len:289 (+) Transcript_22719:978-1844(+)